MYYNHCGHPPIIRRTIMSDSQSSGVSGSKKVSRERAEKLLAILNEKFPGRFTSLQINTLGDVVGVLEPGALGDVAKALKSDPALRFNMLVDITAVDWLDARDERFEVVYQFLSIPNLYRLCIKVPVPETRPEVVSLTSLWSGANFMERETWDMYGVVFTGNTDLRRLLLYEEFQGHPLRKDYPVQGKQPRIRLRYPEVRNTAVDMQRPPLVQIRRRPEKTGPRAEERA